MAFVGAVAQFWTNMSPLMRVYVKMMMLMIISVQLMYGLMVVGFWSWMGIMGLFCQGWAC